MKGGLVAVAIALATYGCARTGTSVCENGVVCPAGLVCSQGGRSCGRPEAVASCATANDGAECEIDGLPAVCSLGVCGEGICGDGQVFGDEECDPAAAVGDCVDYGFGFGVPSCSLDCKLVTDECGDFQPRVIYENPVDGSATYSNITESEEGRIYASQSIEKDLVTTYSMSVFDGSDWREVSLADEVLDIVLSAESAYLIFSNQVLLYDGSKLVKAIALPDLQGDAVVGAVAADGVLWVTDTERVWSLAGDSSEESENLPDSGHYGTFSYEGIIYLSSDSGIYSAQDDGSWMLQLEYPDDSHVDTATFNGTHFYLADVTAGEILLMEPLSSSVYSVTRVPLSGGDSGIALKAASSGSVYLRSGIRIYKVGDLAVRGDFTFGGAFHPEERRHCIPPRSRARTAQPFQLPRNCP